MPTYTQQQIENVWFALNLNRLKPNNDANSGAGLHNPNGSINMYKWLQDALDLLNISGSTTSITEGTDITITGTGTTLDPYVINYSGAGGGTNIYNANGSLTGTRTLQLNGHPLAFTGALDSTHEQITTWNPNSVITKVGQTGITATGDHYVQNTLASIGVISFTEMTSVYTGDTDIITGYLRTDARGSGFELANAEIGVTNQMTGTYVRLTMQSADAANPFVQLTIPTNWEYGAGFDAKFGMTPTLIDEGTNEIRYTYPLQRTVFNFGDANYRVAVNDYATGALATGSNGDKMTAVEVIISARLYANSTGTLEIRILEASSGSDLYTKSIDMATLPNTYGTMSQEGITLPLNIDEQYYCMVTATSGDGTDVKGLSVTLLTI